MIGEVMNYINDVNFGVVTLDICIILIFMVDMTLIEVNRQRAILNNYGLKLKKYFCLLKNDSINKFIIFH